MGRILIVILLNLFFISCKNVNLVHESNSEKFPAAYDLSLGEKEIALKDANLNHVSIHVDTDGDGIADYMDEDIDNDGVLNYMDQYPFSSSKTFEDQDHDQIPDFVDYSYRTDTSPLQIQIQESLFIQKKY